MSRKAYRTIGRVVGGAGDELKVVVSGYSVDEVLPLSLKAVRAQLPSYEPREGDRILATLDFDTLEFSAFEKAMTKAEVDELVAED